MADLVETCVKSTQVEIQSFRTLKLGVWIPTGAKLATDLSLNMDQTREQVAKEKVEEQIVECPCRTPWRTSWSCCCLSHVRFPTGYREVDRGCARAARGTEDP